MRVLVVGGSGMIGRYLVPRLVAEGHEVLVLSRGNAPVPDRRARHARADRRSVPDIAAAVRGTFDAVIDDVAYDPQDAQALFTALSGRFGHYVLTSTAFVYPDLAAHWDGPSPPVREADAPPCSFADEPQPQTAHARYVAGKRRLERWTAERCADEGLPLTIVRPALQLVGPHTEDGRFAWFWLRVRDGGPIWLPTSARTHAGPCQVGFSGDVAQVLLRAALHPPQEQAVYHAAQPELWCCEEYLGVMAAVAGVELDVRYASQEVLNASPFAVEGTYRIPLPYRVAFDVSRASVELGMEWTPMRRWVEETASWATRYYADRTEAWYRLRAQERSFVP